MAARLAGYGEPRGSTARIAASLEILNGTYWWMLDAMNEIPVAPGQVIHNRNPARLLAAGDEPSSEVHALDNPEAREILALEIRKPGPTFRAWDNVRFPVRQVDIAAAVEALNLRATRPAEFSVTPQPIQGRPGVFLSVASDDFRIEQLRPRQDQEIVLEQQGVHCLHGIAGRVELLGAAGDALGYIGAGESLLIPAPMGGYRLVADAMDNHIGKGKRPREAALTVGPGERGLLYSDAKAPSPPVGVGQQGAQKLQTVLIPNNKPTAGRI